MFYGIDDSGYPLRGARYDVHETLRWVPQAQAVIGLGVFYALCFGCLALAMEKIDVSVAYALWPAMGPHSSRS